MKKYSSLFLFVVIFSCKSKNSAILVPDTMKVVIWDMMKADELYSRLTAKDSISTTEKKKQLNIRLYEEVFSIHHITRGSFDSSYFYYSSHPVLLKALLDSVDAYGTRQKNTRYGNFGQSK
jgi:hypothetical protein